MRFLDAIKNSLAWKFILWLQRALLVLSSLFVVLIMCVTVLLRYVFKSDLFGMEEIVVIAAFWLYFMGSSYGVFDQSHVKADIIPQLLPPRGRAILAVVMDLVMAVLFILFTVWAVDMVMYSIEWMPRTTGLRIPVFISQSSVLAGYALMSFYAVVHFFDGLFSFLSGAQESTS